MCPNKRVRRDESAAPADGLWRFRLAKRSPRQRWRDVRGTSRRAEGGGHDDYLFRGDLTSTTSLRFVALSVRVFRWALAEPSAPGSPIDDLLPLNRASGHIGVVEMV